MTALLQPSQFFFILYISSLYRLRSSSICIPFHPWFYSSLEKIKRGVKCLGNMKLPLSYSCEVIIQIGISYFFPDQPEEIQFWSFSCYSYLSYSMQLNLTDHLVSATFLKKFCEFTQLNAATRPLSWQDFIMNVYQIERLTSLISKIRLWEGRTENY